MGALQQTIDECSKKDPQLKADLMAFLGLKPADDSTSVTPDKVKECLQKHGIEENSEQNDVEKLLRIFLENPSMSALTQTGSSQTIVNKFNPLVFYKSH